MKIEGQVFIVTGATFGIGEAVCEALATKGAKLVLAGRNKDQGEAVAKILGERTSRRNDFLFVQTDVAKPEQVKALFKAAIDKFGTVSGLLNNAGISGNYMRDVLKDTDDWLQTLNVNLVGTLLASRLALTHFLRTKQRGIIINTGSVSEFLAHTDPVYVTSKVALSGQVSALQYLAELTGTPYQKFDLVRAVNIAVGFTFTDIWKNSSGGAWTTREQVEADPAFGRDLRKAGGWTEMEKVVGTFVRAIEDEGIKGETFIVSGRYPVVRRRLHPSQDGWEELMRSGSRL